MKSIQQIIDDTIAEERAKRSTRERSGKWSPSSFGRCFRNQFYNRKNEPITNPVDARTLRVFKCGNLFEDFVGDLLVKAVPDIRRQVLCETDDVKGYADFVKDKVWDTKSQHSYSFHYMAKSADIGEDKKPNVLQVLWYAQFLKLNEGVLCFISKDDLCIAEYSFTLTQQDRKWEKELYVELTSLRNYWKDNRLPPAVPRAYGAMESWDKKEKCYKECSYCSWKDKCQKEGGKAWEAKKEKTNAK
jgi:hypothetical protein